MYIHVYIYSDLYVHVYTFHKHYVHVWTMYMMCIYYSTVHTSHIHGSDMYIHVNARWVGFQMLAVCPKSLIQSLHTALHSSWPASSSRHSSSRHSHSKLFYGSCIRSDINWWPDNGSCCKGDAWQIGRDVQSWTPCYNYKHLEPPWILHMVYTMYIPCIYMDTVIYVVYTMYIPSEKKVTSSISML